jgi:hypothetical protein
MWVDDNAALADAARRRRRDQAAGRVGSEQDQHLMLEVSPFYPVQGLLVGYPLFKVRW